MSKPTLFIGSSSESKEIGKMISKKMSRFTKVSMWDEGVFKPGEQYMESLRRQLLLSDFALLIVYPDDKRVKRKKSGYVTRDNVILELGMFMGALNLHRGFYLVVSIIKNKKKITPETPSDLEGLTRFDLIITNEKKKDTLKKNENAINKFTEKLKKTINENHSIVSVDLLPSTPLAIGYFNNLVAPVCKTLSEKSNFTLNKKKYNLRENGFDFVIALPANNEASHQGFEKFVKDYKLKNIQIRFKKSRKFSIMVGQNPKNGKIKFYDFPTTLLSAMKAVDLAKPSRTTNKEIKMMKNREIDNFEKTLSFMLDSDEGTGFRENVSVINFTKNK